MEHIILYGSKYGSTRQYAEALSRQTGIPALRYQDAPNLSDKKTIIYLGGLYAGGILGLSKTFRGFSLRDGQRLIIITVGLSDPAHPETRENIRDPCRGRFLISCFARPVSFIFAAGLTTKPFPADTACSCRCSSRACAAPLRKIEPQKIRNFLKPMEKR